MKDNQTNKSKRKIITYYLILAACLLVAAAITVTLVFTVGRSKSQTLENPVIDQPDDGSGGDENNGDQSGGDENNGNGDNQDDGNGSDVAVTDAYVLPVSNASVINVHATLFYDKTLKNYHEHKGVDFAGEQGDEVYAICDGVVTEIVTNDLLDGSYVTIQHTDSMTATYMFIDPAEGLEKGSAVTKGQVIGTIAAAYGKEYMEGEHLHLEIYVNGVIADPSDYLAIEEK